MIDICLWANEIQVHASCKMNLFNVIKKRKGKKEANKMWSIPTVKGFEDKSKKGSCKEQL